MTTFSAADPRTGAAGRTIEETSVQRIQELVDRARDCFAQFQGTGSAGRAEMLRNIAGALDVSGGGLVEVADRETALGAPRLPGELLRTTGQLRFFADLLEEGSYVAAILDFARPDLTPPRPDIRQMQVPIGPVAVFAASNFPFAFSVAGGDTASALAAGCPVVIKAHPSHPETSTLVFSLMKDALARSGAPDGVISLIEGAGEDVGHAIVLAKGIKAVAFTGSLRGGRALYDLAAQRIEPIPVYAEMGSVNPLVVSPRAALERADEVAAGYFQSITLGTGQFCTKPGLAFVPTGTAGDDWCDRLGTLARSAAGGVMLNARLRSAYETKVRQSTGSPGVSSLLVATDSHDSPGLCLPTILTCNLETFRADPNLDEEHFGPFALIVRYGSLAELINAVEDLSGSLTGTIQAAQGEEAELGILATALTEKVGRLIWNGYPTGVAVINAMQHGGPYPATTASQFTSVGSEAMKRFLRPVAFQSFPDSLLPPALAKGNPLGIMRRVDGSWTRAAS